VAIGRVRVSVSIKFTPQNHGRGDYAIVNSNHIPDGTAAIVFKGSASGGRGGTNVESHALCLAVTKQDNASYGQIYPGPLGFLKQPTASGKRCLGSHSTTSGRKMQAAIVAKKTT